MRLTLLILLLFGLLVLIVLNPALLYSTNTQIGKFTVYHNKALPAGIKLRLTDADNIIVTSEFYDTNLKFDICLNDGSPYPALMEVFLGKAFALGFTSNKIALCGNTDFAANTMKVNGRKWNLTQLIAHEATHCLVFNELGFWKSNPVANNPLWKWEGYPEYVSRKHLNHLSLKQNITSLTEAIKKDKDQWGIILADSTIAPRTYFNYWNMMQYCMDVKKMTYQQVLSDTKSESLIQSEMMIWYYPEE